MSCVGMSLQFRYYRNLPAKIGDILTPAQYAEVEELGMLVDKDDQVRGELTAKYVAFSDCV